MSEKDMAKLLERDELQEELDGLKAGDPVSVLGRDGKWHPGIVQAFDPLRVSDMGIGVRYGDHGFVAVLPDSRELRRRHA